jgi:DNA primase
MAFPPLFLDEVRTRVSLVAVIGRRVKLVRKGREHTGLCPFHNEKSPSFTVNEDKGFFHCFGCGAHGDAIGFEMRIGHLSFTEAVEKLAAEAGLEIPLATPEERQREQRRASLHDAMEAACVFFERQLRQPAGREGLAYLRGRGLTDETIARFRLGWAPDAREALKRAAMSETLPESLLIEAGLLKRPDEGGASFDLFRGRVTYPIADRRGRVIAFGARLLGDGQPKYLNSPETPLFHKGSTLYGLAQAREAARAQGMLVAVEGYMDVIALHQAGLPVAVAPLGTALTEEQILDMWRLADEPILCLDGDAAGQRAMARAAERGLPLVRPGKSLRFAVLPASEDPDSLVRARGVEAMRAVLDQARPLIDVVWEQATRERALDTPERRAALERELKDKSAAIADPDVRGQYWAALKERLWQATRPPRRPQAAFRRGTGARRSEENAVPLRGADGRLPGVGRPSLPGIGPRAPGILGRERTLLMLLLQFPALAEEVAERLGQVAFFDSGLDKLRRGILKDLDATRDLDEDAFCAHLRSGGLAPVLDSLLGADDYKIARPDAVHDARSRWEHVFALYTLGDLQADVEQAAGMLAREPSEVNFARLKAMVASRARRMQVSEDDWPLGTGAAGK